MADNSEPQAVGFLVIKRARLAPSSIGGSIVNRELVSHNRPIFDQLHPAVYKAAVGLVAWFALAAWILFDHQNDIGLLVAVLGLAKTPDGPPKASGKNLIPGLEKCRFRGLGQQASRHACGNRHVVAPGCGRIWSHGVGNRLLDLCKHRFVGPALDNDRSRTDP